MHNKPHHRDRLSGTRYTIPRSTFQIFVRRQAALLSTHRTVSSPLRRARQWEWELIEQHISRWSMQQTPTPRSQRFLENENTIERRRVTIQICTIIHVPISNPACSAKRAAWSRCAIAFVSAACVSVSCSLRLFISSSFRFDKVANCSVGEKHVLNKPSF